MAATTAVNIFQFSKSESLKDWIVINDSIMGGLSESTLKIGGQGNGCFRGKTILQNGAGFCSTRYICDLDDVHHCRSVRIKVKGDGKYYQCRMIANREDHHQYSYGFDTDGSWQVIDIPFSQFRPVFRGKMLDIPKFDRQSLKEIGFLIADKQDGAFRLEIGSIGLLQ